MPTDAPTPRDTRLRLNKLEAWCAANAAALGDRAPFVRSLFEVAQTPEHAAFIEGELRESTGRAAATEAPAAHA